MTSAFVPAVAAPLSAAKSSFAKNSIRQTYRPRTPSTRRAIIYATAIPIEVDEATFDKEVMESSNDQPVLVDFYAEWCGPCKLVSPLMDWAAIEFDGQMKVVKINTDTNDAFVKRYKITGLPTFAVFKAGEANGLKEGAMGKVELGKYISAHTDIEITDDVSVDNLK